MSPGNVQKSPGTCCVWEWGVVACRCTEGTCRDEQVRIQAEIPIGHVEVTWESGASRERGEWEPEGHQLQDQLMPGEARKTAPVEGLTCPSTSDSITRRRPKVPPQPHFQQL